jgi:hypothetical protein
LTLDTVGIHHRGIHLSLRKSSLRNILVIRLLRRVTCCIGCLVAAVAAHKREDSKRQYVKYSFHLRFGVFNAVKIGKKMEKRWKKCKKFVGKALLFEEHPFLVFFCKKRCV